MEKQVYAMVKMDMDAIDEKVKAVIEAHLVWLRREGRK